MFARRILLISAGLICLSQFPSTAAGQAFITAWGGYGSGDGQFLGAVSVAVGGSGDIYVADSEACRIQVFTSTGSFLRGWTYVSDGTPVDMAVDASDNVYVADNGYCGILKFSSTGSLETQWHTSLNLAVDASGNVYAGGGGSIKVFSPSGVLIRKFDTSTEPGGLAVDASGNIYVLSYLGNYVQKYTNAGALLTAWGSYGTGDGQFFEPARVAVDVDGRVYVMEQGNSRVQVFSSNGTFITKWGSYGHGNTPGEFDQPTGIAVDLQGGVYVADKNNSRIQKFGFASTPVQGVTWGSVKARYRGAPGAAQSAGQDR